MTMIYEKNGVWFVELIEGETRRVVGAYPTQEEAEEAEYAIDCTSPYAHVRNLSD